MVRLWCVFSWYGGVSWLVVGKLFLIKVVMFVVEVGVFLGSRV